jgi:hypothetical protein
VLVGEHERGAHAIDALLAGGLLKEIEGGKRLMLSEQRRGVQLLSAKPLGARGEDMRFSSPALISLNALETPWKPTLANNDDRF